VQAFPAIATAIALSAEREAQSVGKETPCAMRYAPCDVLDLIERLCRINAVVREIGPTGPEAEKARAEATFRRAFPRWK